MLQALPEITSEISLLNRQYRVFTDSARMEYHKIVQINHAGLISRFGFVAQEMKDFKAEVLSDIQARGVEINNSEAECILEAENELNNSASATGDIFMLAAIEFMQEISITNDEFVSPTLESIDHLISQFEFEVIQQLAFHNSVNAMEDTISFLFDELNIFKELFELFVSEIYADFIFFEIFSNTKQASIFPLLDNALDHFRLNGSLIRNSLVNCN